jgi:hypothetical protein
VRDVCECETRRNKDGVLAHFMCVGCYVIGMRDVVSLPDYARPAEIRRLRQARDGTPVPVQAEGGA